MTTTENDLGAMADTPVPAPRPPQRTPRAKPPAVKHYAYNETRPWSEFRPLLAATIITVNLLAVFTVVLHLWQWQLPELKVIITTIALYTFTGYSITMGYHRYYTHPGFKTGRVMQALILIGGAMSLEGSARVWVQGHWYHHMRSDQPGDLHSPFQYPGLKGILWSHVGWIFYKTHIPAETELKGRRKAVINDRLVVMQQKYQLPLIALTFAIPFAIGGWDGLLVAGFLRIALLLNFTWMINSVCHLWGRTVEVRAVARNGEIVIRKNGDGSRNNIWIAIQTFGEAYHALHHLFEKIAFHGRGVFALDPTKWLLIVLEKPHIVWDIERPDPNETVEDGAFDLPDDSLIHRGNPPAKELAA